MISMTGPGKIPVPVSADVGALSSPGRLAALRQVGLGAAADAGMERLARLVASTLQVPVALVSLVERDRQVFPGMVGLAEPWATTRQTPLSHSMCQHVTASGSPLILSDAREEERTCDNLAIGDLGVIAYAGMPLTDGQGHVLGSLCAIDVRPRSWTAQELADLADLAEAGSADLRLRIVSMQAHVALERSKLALRAAEELADTTSLVDVRTKVRDLVTGGLRPAYIGLALVDGEQLRRLPDPEISYLTEMIEPVFPLSSSRPSAHAVRAGQIVLITDRAALEHGYGPDAAATFAASGLETVVCVPIPGTRRTLGTLILGWATPYQIDVGERAILSTIAGYTGRAVERALYLDDRITAARQLQQAMLTDLPATPGLRLAALYRPAAHADLVGGDWYDAYPLPSHAGETGPVPTLAVTVGDITGHDMRAAAIMGQVRSMLRQADLDHQGLGPAAAVTAMENACHALSLDATGTLVHAHLRPLEGADGWQLTWTNAGHPPPLLVHADGRAERLNAHELLLWPGMPDSRRIDRQRVLAPGATLLLYTDGLVEKRGADTSLAIDQAAGILSAVPQDQPLTDLLQTILDEVAGPSSPDDIVLLAVQVPA
jgi:serine phosphatase RsbU (regulator of sigma subunit)